MQLEFEGQRVGEEVIYVFRRHISSAKRGLLVLIICVLLGIVPLLIWPGDRRMIAVLLAAIAVGFMGAAYSYMLWYFSYYLLTSERLRQHRQKGLFKKTVVDLDLENILSVSYGVPGMFGSLLDYGTILVQTNVGDLVMSVIAHPETVYNKLEDARHSYLREDDEPVRKKKNKDDEAALDGEISYEKD